MRVAGFILSAGFGTRLGELTKKTPKPLLKVGKHPIIHYLTKGLKASGVEDIWFNLHYLPEQIKDYIENFEKGIHPFFSYETSPLGTAGALVNVKEELQKYDLVFCLYGDIFTNVKFSKLLDFHIKNKAEISIFSHSREKSNSCILPKESGEVRFFLERPSDEEVKKHNIESPYQVNSGLYLLNPKILMRYEVDEKNPLDFPRDIFPEMIKRQGLFHLPIDQYRIAIDSPERLKKANEALENLDFTF